MEFFVVVIILVVLVSVSSYTVAYNLRTAKNEKKYYEELLQELDR